MLYSADADGRGADPGAAPCSWSGWEYDALEPLLSPADSVLELPAGLPSLMTCLAARTGWVTVVEEDAARLSALRDRAGVCGWPNITLTPKIADAGTIGPFDVVVAPWLNSDLLNVRWLTSLTERRVILRGPLRDAALDDLRASVRTLGLDVRLKRVASGDGCWRAMAWLDLSGRQ